MTHDTLEELTAGNFAPHTEVFKDFKCEIVPAKERERFSFTGRKKTKREAGSTSRRSATSWTMERKAGKKNIFRLNSVLVYVDKNNTFYLPTKLAEYLQ